MYVMFLVSIAPDSSTLIKQQTPNPEAQFPSGFPPLAVHSSVVRQRPLTGAPVVKVVIVVAHSSLGNDTNENKENDLVSFSTGKVDANVEIEMTIISHSIFFHEKLRNFEDLGNLPM